jgi:hypothetical protein
MKNQELLSGNRNTTRLSKKLLTEIKSTIGKSDLDILIETLESTIDPDPLELYLLESLYQLKEKIVLAESRINNYLIKSMNKLPENKLDNLYENSHGIGTSKLFE